MLLTQFLATADPVLARAILALAGASAQIAAQIRTVDTSAAGTRNDFGEEQLALDLLADRTIFTALKESGVVAVASSEEQSSAVVLDPAGQFAVAFDPLDGSSLVDVNLAVGTIWGIWPGSELLGRTGAEQVAAGYTVYGPRTTLVCTIGHEPAEFTLQADGSWLRTQVKLMVEEGKMFAPGNLRAAAENLGYQKLIDYWQHEQYTLRYSGGMVPDVHQILRKGKGVFAYPGSATAPAKLRLLYECAPLAKVMEAAGGASSDGAHSILSLPITAYDQRTPVCLGSVAEVRRFAEALSS